MNMKIATLISVALFSMVMVGVALYFKSQQKIEEPLKIDSVIGVKVNFPIGSHFSVTSNDTIKSYYVDSLGKVRLVSMETVMYENGVKWEVTIDTLIFH